MLTDEVRGPHRPPCEVPVRGTRPPAPVQPQPQPRAPLAAHPVRRLLPVERPGRRRT
ncbi:hypothetical protein [Nonomuraea sp. SBT364]|uniref:hypothetical protein n=1 Tax=Nonomuraea sp. SBT364 TaxID=1580530 RepID=UPI000A8C9246|nr:hypothetical protein [Nonomuraea sp. SBT364]